MPVYENASERERIRNLKNDPEVLRALIEAGEQIAEEARMLAPVRTGNLKKSIKAELVADPVTGYEARVGFTKAAYYGTFVELGTEEHPPQPFLRPAAEQYD